MSAFNCAQSQSVTEEEEDKMSVSATLSIPVATTSVSTPLTKPRKEKRKHSKTESKSETNGSNNPREATGVHGKGSFTDPPSAPRKRAKPTVVNLNDVSQSLQLSPFEDEIPFTDSKIAPKDMNNGSEAPTEEFLARTSKIKTHPVSAEKSEPSEDEKLFSSIQIRVKALRTQCIENLKEIQTKVDVLQQNLENEKQKLMETQSKKEKYDQLMCDFEKSMQQFKQ